MGGQVRAGGQCGHLISIPWIAWIAGPGTVVVIEVVEVHKPELFFLIPDHTRAGIVGGISRVGPAWIVVRNGEHLAVVSTRIQVGYLGIGPFYGVGHRTANSRHRIVVGIVQVVLAIRILAMVILDHCGVPNRVCASGRPTWVVVRAVLPVLGLPQYLCRLHHIQWQRSTEVRQIHNLQVVIQYGISQPTTEQNAHPHC